MLNKIKDIAMVSNRWLMALTLSGLAVMTMGQECCGSNCDLDGDGWTDTDGDCNDNNAEVHPGATEICNTLDDNCINGTDELWDCGRDETLWSD